MPPVVAALPVALASAGIAAASGTTIFGLSVLTSSFLIAGTTLVSAGLSHLLAPKPRQQTQVVNPFEVSYGGDLDRKWCYGKSAVQVSLGSGGAVKYWETTGTDNKFLWMVAALHDTPIEAIDAFVVDNTTITFSSNAAQNVFAIGGTPYLWRYDKLGADSQTVETNLDSASTKWGTNHRLRGMAYSVLKFEYNPQVYPQGLPAPLFVIRGRKLWDPRLDVNFGGSGSHDINDESTWTYSNNAALCLLDYLKGVKIAGKFIGGCRVPIAAFDTDSFKAAANLCDENVALKAGGTEKRYTVNGFVSGLEDKPGVVMAMLKAMAGRLSSRGGKIHLQAGAAITSNVFPSALTDDDLAGELRVLPTVSRQDKINTITSVYPEPTANYNAVSAPVLSPSAYVTADGGLVLSREEQHRFTTSVATVERLNKIMLGDAREQLTIEAVFKPLALGISAGDTFSWSSAAAGYSTNKMRCLQRDRLEDGSVRIVARQETDDKYTWAEATEEVTPPGFNTNQYTVLPPVPATPSGLQVTPSAWTLTVNWNGLSSPYVSGYDIFIGPQGSPIGSATQFESDRRGTSYTTVKLAAGSYTVFVRGKDIYGQVGTATSGNFTLTGTATTAQIADGAITVVKLGDGSVTTAKLGDSQVTTAKIGNDQVTTAKIGTAQVTTAKIGDDQVTSAKLEMVGGSTVDELYVRGTGLNKIANNLVVVGGRVDVNGSSRGFTLTVLNRGTHANISYRRNGTGGSTLAGNQVYDVWSSSTDRADMQAALAEIGGNANGTLSVFGASVIVIVSSYDAIDMTGTNGTALVNQMIDHGASEALRGLNGRYPYVLIGIPGIGEGRGIEVIVNPTSGPNAEYDGFLVDGTLPGLGAMAENRISANLITANAIVASKIAAGAVVAGKIAAGAVTASEIAAGSIVAGKIAASAIDTSSLMVDGVVLTAKLATNAATLVAYASGSDVSTLVNDANWHDLTSITYTSEGFPILITADVLIRNDDSGTHGIYIRLVRDGPGRIWPQTSDNDGAFQLRQSDGQTIVVTIAEDLGAGSVTYRLQYKKSDSVNVKCLHPLIQAAEIKR